MNSYSVSTNRPIDLYYFKINNHRNITAPVIVYDSAILQIKWSKRSTDGWFDLIPKTNGKLTLSSLALNTIGDVSCHAVVEKAVKDIDYYLSDTPESAVTKAFSSNHDTLNSIIYFKPDDVNMAPCTFIMNAQSSASFADSANDTLSVIIQTLFK